LPGVKPSPTDLLPKTFLGHPLRRSQTHWCAGELVHVAGADSGKLQDQVNCVLFAVAFQSGLDTWMGLIVK
jgi:hypothetical protein